MPSNNAPELFVASLPPRLSDADERQSGAKEGREITVHHDSLSLSLLSLLIVALNAPYFISLN